MSIVKCLLITLQWCISEVVHCKGSNDFLICNTYAENNFDPDFRVKGGNFLLAMASMEGKLDVFLQDRQVGSRKGPSKETLSDIVHGLRGRMAHVFRIESVVAKLVHDDLVCREIVCNIERSHAQIDRKPCHKLFNAKQQSGLADLVFMGSILEMTDRADCEYELLLDASFSRAAKVDYSLQCRNDFLARQAQTHEVGCRLLEAVRYDALGSPVLETPACSEGYDDLIAFHKMISGCLQGRICVGDELFACLACERCVMTERAPSRVACSDLYAVFHAEWGTADQALDAVENGHRVVQCAERIDAYVESESFELSADVVGKAASEHHDLVAI